MNRGQLFEMCILAIPGDTHLLTTRELHEHDNYTLNIDILILPANSHKYI